MSDRFKWLAPMTVREWRIGWLSWALGVASGTVWAVIWMLPHTMIPMMIPCPLPPGVLP